MTATGCGPAAVPTAHTEAATAARANYARTRYPIVLCPGAIGFDSIYGVIDYFHEIPESLRADGATVYVAHSPGGSSETRGEGLIEQIEDIQARTGAEKFNLIGHSQGGIDVRYVAATRPDLVASVTTIGSPHQGSDLADWLREHIEEGSFAELVFHTFMSAFADVIGILSGHTEPSDAIAALDTLTSEGMAEFNARYPTGLPRWTCDNGAGEDGGIRFYSWAGAEVRTNAADPSDPALWLASRTFDHDNDGMVGNCSAHFGTVIRDDFDLNHLDQVNQVLGLVGSTPAPSVFSTHANRLRNAGL
jgi:triacylglycerol lipase